MARSRVRPLRVRPGARFDCRGDGLCCGDVHLWGPVTAREAEALRLIAPEVLARRKSDGMRVLQAGDDGRCVFWADGCRLHAALGSGGKPRTCRKFPFSLTATPAGGRIGTSHRCSCRTMPSGPLLEPEAAEPSLLDPAGRIRADQRVDQPIPLDASNRIGMGAWERFEADFLERLAREEPEDVLERDPFGHLPSEGWRSLGEALAGPPITSRFQAALAWFGDALLARFADVEPPRRERPWMDSFDRAERAAPPRTARETIADWVADDVWALDWVVGGDFELLRRVLSLRVAVARDVATRIEARGVAPGRAAAEAVLVADLTGISDAWGESIRTFVLRRGQDRVGVQA